MSTNISLLPIIIYYRIQAADKDGSKTYIEIKIITIKSQQPNNIVYPNPAFIQISILHKNDKVETVFIVDSDGRTIKTITLNKQIQNIQINELTTGVYMLLFENGETVKLIKQ